MKNFKGKAIYNPSGKAGEYSYWACNFYVGCSNGCEYCYCKKGILAGAMGGDKAVLKKCFKDETDALWIFCKELSLNIEELKKHGLFFSFTTDPFLSETSELTWRAARFASDNDIPVKFLTKRADWVDKYLRYYSQLTAKPYVKFDQRMYSFGFTLTGHDELEPGASTNAERIEAMKKLHDAGFKTWVSIEPIIDFGGSFRMIMESKDSCDMYKIGLLSGSKLKKVDALNFLTWVVNFIPDTPIYFKDSFLKLCKINRNYLTANCVGADFNQFT